MFDSGLPPPTGAAARRSSCSTATSQSAWCPLVFKHVLPEGRSHSTHLRPGRSDLLRLVIVLLHIRVADTTEQAPPPPPGQVSPPRGGSRHSWTRSQGPHLHVGGIPLLAINEPPSI
ncbi:hypothetical protein NDU88_006073 [Pleurodeles waltl]|uniref:Uncharacterized protein n=1 Tax=Pleurodeles waltl TaxID=8319 RepID=A0AAV7NS11_PLEWA|nr:hypothetical protein NDU88_006073 [Pleurodeles waltl]